MGVRAAGDVDSPFELTLLARVTEPRADSAEKEADSAEKQKMMEATKKEDSAVKEVDSAVKEVDSAVKEVDSAAKEVDSAAKEVDSAAKSSLFLSFDNHGHLLHSARTAPPSTPRHAFIRSLHPEWLHPQEGRRTALGRAFQQLQPGVGVYMTGQVPHFVELPTENSGPSVPSCPDGCPLRVEHLAYSSERALEDDHSVERALEEAQAAYFEASLETERQLCRLVEAAAGCAAPEATLAEDCAALEEALLQYTKEKRPELMASLESAAEEDVICGVCGNGDSDYGNMIVFCDGCNCAVHQGCYGLLALPTGAWFCDVCAALRAALAPLPAGQEEPVGGKSGVRRRWREMCWSGCSAAASRSSAPSAATRRAA